MLVKVRNAGEGAFDIEVRMFELSADEVEATIEKLKKVNPHGHIGVEHVDQNGHPVEPRK